MMKDARPGARAARFTIPTEREGRRRRDDRGGRARIRGAHGGRPAKLQRMALYAQTAQCRWKELLSYFGEDGESTAAAPATTARIRPTGSMRRRSTANARMSLARIAAEADVAREGNGG